MLQISFNEEIMQPAGSQSASQFTSQFAPTTTAPSAPSSIIAVAVFKNNELSSTAAQINEQNNNFLTNALKINSEFSGEFCTYFTIFSPFQGCDAIIVIGLGEKSALNPTRCAELGAIIYKNYAKFSEKINISFDDDIFQNIQAHMAFGMKIRSWQFNHYKTKKRTNDRLNCVNFTTNQKDENVALFYKLSNIASGINLARYVILEPGNVITPKTLSQIAQNELLPLGVEIDILDVAQMQNLKMGGILAVGQGSENPARMVTMKWLHNQNTNSQNENSQDSSDQETNSQTPTADSTASQDSTEAISTNNTDSCQHSCAKKCLTIALIGKGVTFDSGGLNIKPDKSMQGMQYDMSGAATVLGIMKAVALNKLPVNIIGIMGLAENMPSGSASRPGDIITTMSKQTVEILNTDAEGRVVLADALWYVQEKYQPDVVIDFATLTGAIQVALGTEYAGLFSNCDCLVEKIQQASNATGEKVWRMPLCETFNKAIDSNFADVCNISKPGTGAGASTAAHFLQRFIKEGVNWAHLDIAGVTDENRKHKLTGSGAPGYGVRLVYQMLEGGVVTAGGGGNEEGLELSIG